jgi:uncharacterized lipoprotein YbaY/heat shock protein HslJ
MGNALAQGSISGTATYRECIALPPDAVFEATLEDVSKADARAEVLGRATIKRPSAPPFQFTIDYDPARIEPRFRYALRATIRARSRLLFTTDKHYPVLTQGAPQSADLLLRRVSAEAATAPAVPSALGTLPATFMGVLPCADCPGIEHQLNLFPDRVYHLRRVYQGKRDGQFDDIGSWAVSSDGRVLILSGGRGEPLQFAVRDSNRLARLDLQGRPIPSEANHDIVRAGAFTPIEPRVATEPLQNTYWKLVRLRDEPVIVEKNQREPHIVLHAEGRRVAGSGGCNSLLGGYRLDDNRIAFEKLASTMMACVAGMEQERRFLGALGEAASWRVLGSHLELFDADGALLARLEARHLK